MSQLDPNRRFQIAYDRARADWAAADPARCAALAGCVADAGRRDRALLRPAAPGDASRRRGRRAGHRQARAHMTIAIVLMHYLLTADGTPPADRWLAFRELPDGLFYAQAFAGHAEGLLARGSARHRRVSPGCGGVGRPAA